MRTCELAVPNCGSSCSSARWTMEQASPEAPPDRALWPHGVPPATIGKDCRSARSQAEARRSHKAIARWISHGPSRPLQLPTAERSKSRRLLVVGTPKATRTQTQKLPLQNTGAHSAALRKVAGGTEDARLPRCLLRAPAARGGLLLDRL